jgi:hypothetical protein
MPAMPEAEKVEEAPKPAAGAPAEAAPVEAAPVEAGSGMLEALRKARQRARGREMS